MGAGRDSFERGGVHFASPPFLYLEAPRLQRHIIPSEESYRERRTLVQSTVESKIRRYTQHCPNPVLEVLCVVCVCKVPCVSHSLDKRIHTQNRIQSPSETELQCELYNAQLCEPTNKPFSFSSAAHTIVVTTTQTCFCDAKP